MIDKEILFGAIARGWCSPSNAGKIIDTDLINAIVDELESTLNPAKSAQRERDDWNRLGSSSPRVKQPLNVYTDEQINNALESARECIVEGKFGYYYNENNLFKAIRSLATTSTEPTAEPTMASARAMAIAQAVRQACNSCYSPDDTASDLSDKVGDLDLAGIIASIGASPAPSAKQEPSASEATKAQAKADLMPRREAFIKFARSRGLDASAEKKGPWGEIQFSHPHIESMWYGWLHALDAAPSASASPAAPGFVLVPVEPTREMLNAICGKSSQLDLPDAYAAMLAASPAAAVAAPAPAFDALGFARKVRELSLDYAAMHFDGVDAKCSSIYVSHYLRNLQRAPLDISGIVGEFAAPVAGSQHVPDNQAGTWLYDEQVLAIDQAMRLAIACGNDSLSQRLSDIIGDRNFTKATKFPPVAAAAPAVPLPAEQDQARDAARYRGVRATTTAIRNPETGEREECTPEQFDAAVDAELAAPSLQQPKEGAA